MICPFLQVKWDDDVDTGRQNRVSPWEIEPTNSISGHNNLLAPGSKRTKISIPMVYPDFPVPSRSFLWQILVYNWQPFLCFTFYSISLSLRTFFLSRWKWVSQLGGICKVP